ncbi:MAG: transposase [Anaerolineae bacterium]|nr:transposase [Anaerolineae bacterium]
MDNLSCHKTDKVRHLIDATAAQLLFLPAYAPDFSPIEQAFSKANSKHFCDGLRRKPCRHSLTPLPMPSTPFRQPMPWATLPMPLHQYP